MNVSLKWKFKLKPAIIAVITQENEMWMLNMKERRNAEKVSKKDCTT